MATPIVTGGIKPPKPTTTPDPFESMGGGVQMDDGGWVPTDHPLAEQKRNMTPAPPPPSAAAPAQTAAPAPPAAAPVASPQQQVQDVFRNSLMEQLQAPAVDPMDAQSDPRAAAFRVAQKRNYDRDRAQTAESAAVNGLSDTGAFQGAVRGLGQQRAESEAAFEAGLVGERMTERRAELANAMAMAGALGDRESAAALQRELASLDADVQREGYGVTREGQQIQRYGIDRSAELDAADQTLRRYGLDLSNKQESNRLGFDYASLIEQANRDAVLAALGL